MAKQVVAENRGNSRFDGVVLDAVRTLGGPMLAERSAKLIGGELREGRYLVSMPKSALYPGPGRQLARVCRDLGAPVAGYERLAPHVSAAISVHFGYEPDDGGDLFKCYLEFPADKAPRAGMVFLALKWVGGTDPAETRFQMSQYWSRSDLSPSRMGALIDTIVPSGGTREAAHRFLDIARISATGGAGALLEVEEPDTPRRSIDINLADSGRRLADFRETLEPVFEEAGVGPARDAFFAREGMTAIGHFAAGTARDGTPFATLYFGAEAI